MKKPPPKPEPGQAPFATLLSATFRYHWKSLVIAVVTMGLVMVIWGEAGELHSLDLRFRLRPASSQPSPVTLVVLRGEKIAPLRQTLRESIADFLSAQAALPTSQHPRAIVVDATLALQEEASSGQAPQAERIREASQTLRRVVQGFELALKPQDARGAGGQLRDLGAHLLPMSRELPTTPTAQGYLLAHSSISGPLYASAAGAGFTNLSPESREEGIARTLPMLAILPGEHSHASQPGLAMSLSLAGAAVALCGKVRLVDCIQHTAGGIWIRGDQQRLIPIDDARGEYRLNLRKRFQYGGWSTYSSARAFGPDSSYTISRGTEPGSDAALDSVLMFHSCQTLPEDVSREPACSSGSPGWMTLGDGVTPVSLERLSQQIVLLVDGQEPAQVFGAFGSESHPATLHSQAIANILENDFVRVLPKGMPWLFGLLLLGLAQLLRAGSDYRRARTISSPSPDEKTGASRLQPLWNRAPEWLHPVILALVGLVRMPEVLVGALWCFSAWGLFCLQSLWLPVVGPMAALVGFIGSFWWHQPGLQSQYMSQLASLMAYRAGTLEALAACHAELSGLAQLLEQMPDTLDSEARDSAAATGDRLEKALTQETKVIEKQASAVPSVPSGITRLSAEDQRQLQDALHTSYQLLRAAFPEDTVAEMEGMLPPPETSPKADWVPPGDLVRFKELLTTLRELQKQLGDNDAALKRLAQLSPSLQHWNNVRTQRYEASLKQLGDKLQNTANQLKILKEAQDKVTGKSTQAEAPLPPLLETIGFVTGDKNLQVTLETLFTSIVPFNIPIMLLGESGTGKEVLAQAIHLHSKRAKEKFRALNSAALPEPLFESFLFGHMRGAFTDAKEDKPGLLEVIDGGTLFLDELGNMPLAIQEKLLRFLESGTFLRVGDTSAERRANVRIIVATNADLPALIKQNKFKLDLYYRLQDKQVTIPPLRNRAGDIERLSKWFLERWCKECGKEREFGPGAIDALKCHAWRGNVRELRSTVNALALEASGKTITEEQTWKAIRAKQPILPEVPLSALFESDELQYLERLRAESFRTAGLLDDKDDASERVEVTRRFRPLWCKALWLTGWSLEGASVLLAGEDKALQIRVKKKISAGLKRLKLRLQKEPLPDLQDSIQKQRGRYLHVFRLLDALQHDLLRMD